VIDINYRLIALTTSLVIDRFCLSFNL